MIGIRINSRLAAAAYQDSINFIHMDNRGIYSAFLVMLLVLPGSCVMACSERLGPKGIPQLVVPLEPDASWEKEDYFTGLLQLALNETADEFGPCEILPTDSILTRMRSLALINNYGIDVFWATTSLERESLLRPVRIPLLKGLMGYKILLINPEDQPRFSRIKNLQELTALRAGVGVDWPDNAILRANGIETVTSVNYEALFRMLAAKRFDFFPRGASEVWTEHRNHPEVNLHVEQDLVLVYPAPVYFFVNMNNHALEQRLTQGLHKLIANGKFDQYFFSHAIIVDAIQRVNLGERRKIYLNNPLLPPATPLTTERYWLYPWRGPLAP